MSVSSPTAYALLMECPEKYRLQYVEKLRPSFDGPALGIGTAVHRLLETYYRAELGAAKEAKKVGLPGYQKVATEGSGHPLDLDSVVREYEKLGPECDTDNDRLKYLKGLATIGAVAELYPAWAREHDNFTVLEVEGGVEKQVTKTFEGRRFRLDMLIEDNHGRFVVDFKCTTKQSSSNYLSTADMRLQTLMYVAAEKADGIIYQMVYQPTIRQGKAESVHGFCERVKDQYRADPSKFLSRHRYRVDHEAAAKEARTRFAGADMMVAALKALPKGTSWPKNDAACYKWGRACPLLPSCRFGIPPEELFSGTTSD